MAHSPSLNEKNPPPFDYEGVRLETVLAIVRVLGSLRSSGSVQITSDLQARKAEVFQVLSLVARAAGLSIQCNKSEVSPVLANEAALMKAINEAYRPRTERSGAPVANKLSLLEELVSNMFASKQIISIDDARAKLFGDRKFKDEAEKDAAYIQMFQWIRSLNGIFYRNKLPITILCTQLGISMRNRDAL